MYNITLYTYLQAKKIGVIVKPSKKKGKKIDVFKNGVLVASVGDRRYLDYPYYKKYFGKQIANERRKNYKLRHKKNRLVKNSPGWYAAKLLW